MTFLAMDLDAPIQMLVTVILSTGEIVYSVPVNSTVSDNELRYSIV